MTPLLRNDLVEAAPPALPRNDLLQRISPARRARLARFMDVVPLPAGTVLCETGAPLRHVWFPHDAVAATVVPFPDGALVDVGLLGPEALVGTDSLFGERRSATTVVVQIAGSASRIAADDFSREVVCRADEPYRMFMRFAAAYQRLMAQLAACNAHHDIVQRLARWLLMLDDRIASGVVGITQERLAVLLAARRASITKAATALRSCGALEYRRGSITIRDRRALLGASCGCYPVLAGLVPQADRAAQTVPLARLSRTG
jgi:CRP-like cAMP-binding protein